MAAPAGYTAVSSAHLSDASGALITNATISFQPVTSSGTVTSFHAGEGGAVISSPVSALVTNGAFTLNLADTTLTQPVNIGYRVVVEDNVTGKSLLGPGYSCVQPFGPTWSLDDYQADIASIVTVQTGPRGSQGPSNSISIGTVTSDATPSASLTGVSPNQVLNLVFPKGDKGDPGDVSTPQLSQAIAPLSSYFDRATYGLFGVVPASAPPPPLTLLAQGAPTVEDGNLERIELVLGLPANPANPAPGVQMYFGIFSAVSTGANTQTFTSIAIIPLTAKGNGTNTFIAGEDFDAGIHVPAGSYYGLFCTNDGTNANSYYSAADGVNKLWLSTLTDPGRFPPTEGQTFLMTSNNNRMNTRITLQLATSSASVPTPDAITKIAQTNKNANHALIYETQFPGAAAPAGWVLGAGWTVSDGLVSPASPTAYSVFSQLQQPYNAEQRTDRIQFEILTSDAIVAVGARNGLQTSDPAFGTLIRVNASAQTLAITNRYIAGTDPGDNASIAIPFPVVMGQKYWLSIVSNKQELTAILTDPVSAAQATVHVGNNATDTGARPAWGNMWDWPTAVAPQGRYKLHDWRILANSYKPHMYIEGDSITYGLGVARAVRWAQLLADAAGSSSVISGRSGAYSTNTVLVVNTEIATLLPDYVVILIGTNNATNGSAQIAPFTSDINAIVSTAKQYAQKVVLGTLPCRAAGIDDSGFNAAILAAGADAVLRFDLATSVGHDGVTQDATLFQGDNLHPNAAGHAAMFARVAADAPWLPD